MCLTIVLANVLVREPAFGRRRAVSASNGLIFPQSMIILQLESNIHTCISIINPEKQFRKLKARILECL